MTRFAIAALLLLAGCALASLSGRWVLALPAPPLFAYVAAGGVLVILPLVGIVSGYGRRAWLWGLTASLIWVGPLVGWTVTDSQTVRRLVHLGRWWPVGEIDARLVPVTRTLPPTPRSAPLVDPGIAPDAGPAEVAIQEHPSQPHQEKVEVFEDAQGVLTIKMVGQPEPPKPDEAVQQSAVVKFWPLPAVPHPVAETARQRFKSSSYRAAARFIADQVKTPADRIRAVHDFVARHLRYDVLAWKTRKVGPQDAETVFRSRKAVCAGYAQLVHAMAQEAGLKTEVVVGHAFVFDDPEPQSHAWNAVYLDGAWALLDATWNSGFIKDGEFVARYDTAYLFTPAAIMLETHTPEYARHRLLSASVPEPAKDRPYRHPRFHALGLKTEVRATMKTSDGRLEFKVLNRNRLNMQAKLQSGQTQTPCSRVDETFSCPVPPGRHTITVYAGPESTLDSVLRFKVEAEQ